MITYHHFIHSDLSAVNYSCPWMTAVPPSIQCTPPRHLPLWNLFSLTITHKCDLLLFYKRIELTSLRLVHVILTFYGLPLFAHLLPNAMSPLLFNWFCGCFPKLQSKRPLWIKRAHYVIKENLSGGWRYYGSLLDLVSHWKKAQRQP